MATRSGWDKRSPPASLAHWAALASVQAAAYEVTEEREPCAHRNPQRNVYFGDLHVHTVFSQDASTQGTRATPRDAYRFARGEPLRSPGGELMQLSRPLDFVAVTDATGLATIELPAPIVGMPTVLTNLQAAVQNSISVARLSNAVRVLITP